MPFVDLIFSGDARGTTIGTLTLDALASEVSELPSEATLFPVEDASPATDAILPGAPKLSITGTVSAANVTLLGGLLSGDAAGPSGKPKLLKAAAALDAIYRQHKPVTVATGVGLYTNMAMTSAKITRDNGPAGGNVLTIQCEFTKIRKVVLRTANVPADDATKGKTGATRASAGKAATTEPAPAVQQKAAGIAKSFTRYIGL